MLIFNELKRNVSALYQQRLRKADAKIEINL